ncbi:DNA-binding response regulator, NarL/FixJ family, contains REC and HTH domains [Streptomyces sp. 3213]|uniref:response regulator n=1 Tax=Streptomyces sp. 3213.3 TaxID=1855348 RepID=UPI000895C05E|nr:response regulator transcription factor [Streptomyces sp. 3213.3]SEE83322.1 DNA-binding response regulator, NarL/FixJ family, contains REC and HTH domains [Streptomyces sp. 3213] [Streptomyces sp. 3213.3]
MTISVLLADDQALVRMAFRSLLDTMPGITVVGESADGAEAVELARRILPDVVLMDVRMPVMDGIEATRRITSGAASRVLILTTFDLDEYAFEGLRAGACGFLLKDVVPAVLQGAIRAVASGDAVLTPRITRGLVDRFAQIAPRPRADDAGARFAHLTAGEREVFHLVAAGLSNAEIAERLFLTEATVKTHITRILTKLELRDRVQVVIFAYEHQLRAQVG